jgi:hypothetical protein
MIFGAGVAEIPLLSGGIISSFFGWQNLLNTDLIDWVSRVSRRLERRLLIVGRMRQEKWTLWDHKVLDGHLA